MLHLLNHCSGIFVVVCGCQVTKDLEQQEELMREAVRAAAEFNRQCAELRKTNRERCVDTHTKVTEETLIDCQREWGVVVGVSAGLPITTETATVTTSYQQQQQHLHTL